MELKIITNPSFDEVNKYTAIDRSRIDFLANEIDLWSEMEELKGNDVVTLNEMAHIYTKMMSIKEDGQLNNFETEEWIVIDSIEGYFIMRIKHKKIRDKIVKDAE